MRIASRFTALAVLPLVAIASPLQDKISIIPQYQPMPLDKIDANDPSSFTRCHYARGSTAGDAYIASGDLQLIFQALGSGYLLQSHQCYHKSHEHTVVQFCNVGTQPAKVDTGKEIATMASELQKACAADEKGNFDPLAPYAGVRQRGSFQLNIFGTGSKPATSANPRSRVSRILRRQKGGNEDPKYCSDHKGDIEKDGKEEWSNCKIPGHTTNSNGNCAVGLHTLRCASYCEVRRRRFYGPEVWFPNTKCDATADCTFSKSVSVGVSHSFNVGLTGKLGNDDTLGSLFSLAVGYTYQRTVTHTTGWDEAFKRRDKDAGYCGYLTFIPQLWETCGDLTTADSFTNAATEGRLKCKPEKLHTIHDACSTYPAKNADGAAIGESVMVWYTCGTNRKAPDSVQESHYLWPGVKTWYTPDTPAK